MTVPESINATPEKTPAEKTIPAGTAADTAVAGTASNTAGTASNTAAADHASDTAQAAPQRQLYSHAITQSPAFLAFQVDFAVCLKELREYSDKIIAGNYQTPDLLLSHTDVLIRQGQTTKDTFEMLHSLRAVDDSIYAHSLNVALIARMVGKWLKFPADDLKTLTLCGLLHDIGKTLIPEDLLNKQGRLTDDEYGLLCQHAQFGYDLLANLPLDSRVKKAALMHHERCDGSGYPRRVKTEDIDDYANIIAIADVYDAMTAARTYRAAFCPFQVIAEFEKDGLQKYKPKFILTFLEHIAAAYQNSRVLLSDSRAANIVLLNRNHLSQPLVQLDNGECMDLSRSEISINSLV